MLDVPADALATDVEITVTPIVAMPDAPFEDAFVAGVRLEPEGLHFLRSVTVRTASPGVPVLTAHGTSNGSDISLIPHDVHADEIAIDMTHFTIVAVWEARQEIVRITTERLLSRGEDLALQRLALRGPSSGTISTRSARQRKRR